MGEEIWRPVNGLEGEYEISSHGRVKSLARFSKGRIKQFIRERILRQYSSPRRAKKVVYPVVFLDGKQRHVHELVLEAFVGKRPVGMESCHNDGNPSNNRVENLRWDTHTANMRDKVAHGTHLRGHRKLTEDQVREIRRLRDSARSLAPRFGVSREAILDIRRGNTWRHVV